MAPIISWSPLLNHIHPFPFVVGKKSLQCINVRLVARLYRFFDIPFRDGRVFLTNAAAGDRVYASCAEFLDERGLGSSSIIVRMSAIRKLAVEATDNGLLAPELAAGIQRVKSAKSIGVRAGNWLSLKQAQALLNVPDITTTKGLRDRAIIAVLLGCALRRSEVAALTMSHIQQRSRCTGVCRRPAREQRNSQNVNSNLTVSFVGANSVDGAPVCVVVP
jgi:integrase